MKPWCVLVKEDGRKTWCGRRARKIEPCLRNLSMAGSYKANADTEARVCLKCAESIGRYGKGLEEIFGRALLERRVDDFEARVARIEKTMTTLLRNLSEAPGR
jgi:hypothetical protein